eukprot:366573-Chlamydomonas_euryale.AAC.17
MQMHGWLTDHAAVGLQAVEDVLDAAMAADGGSHQETLNLSGQAVEMRTAVASLQWLRACASHHAQALTFPLSFKVSGREPIQPMAPHSSETLLFPHQSIPVHAGRCAAVAGLPRGDAGPLDTTGKARGTASKLRRAGAGSAIYCLFRTFQSWPANYNHCKENRSQA